MSDSYLGHEDVIGTRYTTVTANWAAHHEGHSTRSNIERMCTHVDPQVSLSIVTYQSEDGQRTPSNQ